MIEPFIDAFAKLASGEVSKRQVIFVLTCFICALIFLAVYEQYTSNFRFSRLEKATKLLNELNSIKSDVQSDEHLKSIHSTIVSSLEEVVGIETPKISKHSGFWKFLGGFWIWFLLGLFTLSRGKDGKRDFYASYGFWCVGSIFALFCILLPEVYWPWFHCLVYPLVILLLILLSIILVVTITKSKAKAKVKAQQEKDEI